MVTWDEQKVHGTVSHPLDEEELTLPLRAFVPRGNNAGRTNTGAYEILVAKFASC
jgi:hypothetical protein